MEGASLRCTCKWNRLLAVVGTDRQGAYLHIKSHRGGKTLSEFYLESGRARILCLSCNRWTTVLVRRDGVERLQSE